MKICVSILKEYNTPASTAYATLFLFTVLKGEIKKFFSGDVLDDEETLARYSRDASLLMVRPECVVYPKSVDDITKLVRFVRNRKHDDTTISITARSGGTDMSGGPLNESIILDVSKHFSGTREINGSSATVLPGTFYRDFEKEAAGKNLMLPSYTASKEICTVGGMVANNSGGEKTLRYGKTADYVTELDVVLSDGNVYTFRPLEGAELHDKLSQNDFEGELYRKMHSLVTRNVGLIKRARPDVTKNSAGYALWDIFDGRTFDLTRLLCGSQGTLGIMTKITVRLVPIPRHSRLLVIFLKDLAPLSDVVNKILPFQPESLESYDDHTLRLAIRFFPDFLKTMQVSNLLSLAIAFIPEFFMVLRGGFPKLVLLAEFSARSETEAEERVRGAYLGLSHVGFKTRIIRSKTEAKKYWTIRRESFNLLRKHVHGKRTAPFIDDVVVRPEYLPKFLPELIKLLDEYKLLYTIAGHAGDGNFHVIPLMDMTDPHNAEIIPELSERVYDLVLRYQGSITAEHNDGIIRTPYLQKMFGEEVTRLFREVKCIFDPDNIFNPGKKVGGSLEYIASHILRGPD